jgi:hypothetical protein
LSGQHRSKAFFKNAQFRAKTAQTQFDFAPNHEDFEQKECSFAKNSRMLPAEVAEIWFTEGEGN